MTTSGVYGADVSSAVSVAGWQALMSQHSVTFGIVRCYESTGNVDPNAPATVNNGWSAGLDEVDVYHFPSCSVDATTQVNDAVNALWNAGAKFNRYWIDVESGAGWSATNFSQNATFLQDLINAAVALGLTVGVYSSPYEWSQIIEASNTQFAQYLLWYADYDAVANFNDYASVAFGGWTTPTMKQFKGDETCTYSGGTIAYDGNWAPALASNPPSTGSTGSGSSGSGSGSTGSGGSGSGSAVGRSADDVRSYATKIAQRVVGLDANTAASNAVSYQSYVSFTTPGDTSVNQAEFATQSGCGLVVGGIWRATGVWASQLYAPYANQIGQAISRLITIAQNAGAYVPYTSSSAPSPGDMVLLDASGSDTHVYTVLTITPGTGNVQYSLTSVDGGQVDTSGFETILQKSRTWSNGQDTVAAQGANPQSTRPISAWIDITKLPLLPAAPLWGYAQNGPSAKGFDTQTPLTSTTAAQIAAAGYAFCVRTLATTTTSMTGILTRQEATAILGAGLGLMGLQPSVAAGLTASNATTLGQASGQAAADNALAAGLPMATCLWLTLDGVPQGTSATTVSSFANAWYTAVLGAGFTPGVYYGAACGLTSQELYQNLSFAHYWEGSGTTVKVYSRGEQVVQSASTTVSGVSINPDQALTDNDGGQVVWLITQPYVASQGA